MQCEHDGFCASHRRFLSELISIPGHHSDEDHIYLLRQKSQAKAARFRV